MKEAEPAASATELVSENDSIRNQTARILNTQDFLEVLSFKGLNGKTYWDYDILIIDFDKLKVNNRDFSTILELKCKGKIPILALLEESSVLDQFEVLALGAVDYLELPVEDNVYKGKLHALYKWKWYYNWEQKNSSFTTPKE